MTETDRPRLHRCRVDQPAREAQAASVRQTDAGELTFWALAVDKQPTPNRNGFVFDWRSPADVDVSALRENGTVLYSHDADPLPVGRIEKIEVGPQAVRMFVRISAYPELEPLRRWVRDGYLRAVSIGFYLREAEEVDLPGPDGAPQPAVLVRAFEIVELSLCSIGAHPTALIQRAPSGPVAAPGAWRTEAGPDGTVLHRLSLEAPADPAPWWRRVDGADFDRLRRAMARALGARGAQPDARAHAHLAGLYAAHNVRAPEFSAAYATEDLRALHEAGLILVPGIPAPPAERAQRLREELYAAQARIHDLAHAAGPEVRPRPAADETALRARVREVLAGHPGLAQARAGLVALTLQTLKET